MPTTALIQHPQSNHRMVLSATRSAERQRVGGLFALRAARGVCAVLLLIAATAIASPAQTFTTLGSFNGINGDNPQTSFVQGLDGDLYGTAIVGGTASQGTIFKITAKGGLKTLYTFCQTDCNDGALPSGLVLGFDGNFYGTTAFGGLYGSGTVFKVTPQGSLTTLYSFCAQTNCPDGNIPQFRLVLGLDGDFYGTGYLGGAYNEGTIFKITSKGEFTTLYSFCSQTNCTDGVGGELFLQGTDGNLYGTAQGGVYNGGVVFRITPKGVLSTLYSFCVQVNCADGAYPAGLLQAVDGNFYGVAGAGGNPACNQGCGTVFKLTPKGALTTLYSFCPATNCPDGAYPAGLTQATDGNLYGTTYSGGIGGLSCCGTIVRITPEGTFTNLYTFCLRTNCPDGQQPAAGLMQATSGKFYGAAEYGGAYNLGTIFSLDMGLGPFVETLPTAGKVGARVVILGTNLKGATEVSFNGTAAAFKVVSNSEISTTVPSGATSGSVSVTTPGGSLTSNVMFRVKP